MLLFKRLHSSVQKAVENALVLSGHVDGPLDYLIVDVRGDKNFMYYMKPRIHSRSFVFEVDTTGASPLVFHMGDTNGQYAERPTDCDKTKRNMERGKIVLHGYMDASTGRNKLVELEAIFHPSQTPKPLPKVELSERERRILYCFGALKNNGLRKEALSRLEVNQKEIDILIGKGVLKKTGSGPIMTLTGEVNRLPSLGRILEDQW